LAWQGSALAAAQVIVVGRSGASGAGGLAELVLDLYQRSSSSGVLGFGDVNYDCTVPYTDKLKDGRLSFPEGSVFHIYQKGRKLAEIAGPHLADKADPADAAFSLQASRKHTSGQGPAPKIPQVITYTDRVDCVLSAGGGIANVADAFRYMTTAPMALVSLRGEGLDRDRDLMRGVDPLYIGVAGAQDQINMVFEHDGGRAITRGPGIPAPASFAVDTSELAYKIGTIVIDSAKHPGMVREALGRYGQQRLERTPVGVAAVTPKMDGSYDLLWNEAVPKGFIMVFSPEDLLAFTGRDVPQEESDISYGQLFEALREVRDAQGETVRRIYLTLGGYGSIGVGRRGNVYRVGIFPVDGKQYNGAGDFFCAGVVKHEHYFGMNQDAQSEIYHIMAFATASSALRIDGISPFPSELRWKLRESASNGGIKCEQLGTLDALSAQGPSLGEIGQEALNGAWQRIGLRY